MSDEEIGRIVLSVLGQQDTAAAILLQPGPWIFFVCSSLVGFGIRSTLAQARAVAAAVQAGNRAQIRNGVVLKHMLRLIVESMPESRTELVVRVQREMAEELEAHE